MIHSPLNLRLLLHYYYSPDPWPEDPSAASLEGQRYLVEKGMISRLPRGNDFRYEVTPRGLAYIKHILATPFPEVHWIVPQQEVKP